QACHVVEANNVRHDPGLLNQPQAIVQPVLAASKRRQSINEGERSACGLLDRDTAGHVPRRETDAKSSSGFAREEYAGALRQRDTSQPRHTVREAQKEVERQERLEGALSAEEEVLGAII